MNYKTRQIWAMMVVTITIFITFLSRVFSKYSNEGIEAFSNVKYWANTMLYYVIVMVISIIVVLIVLNILSAIFGTVRNEVNKKQNKEEIDIDEMFDDTEDEMDKLIAMKASQVSYAVVGVGFVWGLITIYMDMPFGVMLCIQFTSFVLANIVESIIKLYFYKRGVIHG